MLLVIFARMPVAKHLLVSVDASMESEEVGRNLAWISGALAMG